MSETLLYVILLKLSIQKSDVHLDFPTDREKKDGEFLEGNNRFEGYSLELIDGISKILGFQYRMELVPDGKYGSYNKVTKKWDGLVENNHTILNNNTKKNLILTKYPFQIAYTYQIRLMFEKVSKITNVLKNHRFFCDEYLILDICRTSTLKIDTYHLELRYYKVDFFISSQKMALVQYCFNRKTGEPN